MKSSAREINMKLTCRIFEVQMAEKRLSGIRQLIEFLRSPPFWGKICLGLS